MNSLLYFNIVPNKFKKMKTLKNKIIVVMPSIIDPLFSKTLIYIVKHDNNGTSGLIINKKVNSNKHFFDSKNNEDANLMKLSNHLFLGGPVISKNFIVIHPSIYNSPDSLLISKNISITNIDSFFLKKIQSKKNIKHKIIIGYSGWSPGQIEKEISQGDWLAYKGTNKLIFNKDSRTSWAKVIKSIGIDNVANGNFGALA